MNSIRKNLADPLKGIASLLIALFLLFYSVLYLRRALYLESAIFFVCGLLFLPSVYMYASRVSVSNQSVCVRFLMFQRMALSWNDIAEVGVLETSHLFRKKGKKRHGSRYFYFSTKPLTKEERFALALRWPPFRIAFCPYTEEMFSTVQLYWDDDVQGL